MPGLAFQAYNISKNLMAPVALRARPHRGSLGLDGDLGATLMALEELAPALESAALDRGPTVVELGPGRAPEITAAFVLAGAREAVGLDVSLQVPGDAADPARYRELATALSQGGAPQFLSALSVQPGHIQARHAAVQRTWPARFSSYDGVRVPLPDESVDLVFSNAVLEHVSRPRALLAEMHRVLKPDGAIVHIVDLRDHLHVRGREAVDGDWLEALRYSDRAFRAMFSNRSTYINRLRAVEWRGVLSRTGFEIMYWTELRLDLPEGFDRSRLHERWARLPEEELRVSGVHFAARRAR